MSSLQLPNEIWELIYHYVHDLRPIHEELFNKCARDMIYASITLPIYELIFHKSFQKIKDNDQFINSPGRKLIIDHITVGGVACEKYNNMLRDIAHEIAIKEQGTVANAEASNMDQNCSNRWIHIIHIIHIIQNTLNRVQRMWQSRS